jgi:hypothetical protein
MERYFVLFENFEVFLPRKKYMYSPNKRPQFMLMGIPTDC